MRVEALELSRPAWGDKKNQLCGALTLKDANGAELKIPLTSAGVSRLIAAISAEVVSTLKETALQAPRALQMAQDAGYLIAQDGKIDNL